MSERRDLRNYRSGLMEAQDIRWMDDAFCKGTPRELFFPGSGQKDIAVARAICAQCPVQQECLEFAIRSDSQGIWGGTDEKQRKSLARKFNIVPFGEITPHGTERRYQVHLKARELPVRDHCESCADAHRLRENERNERRLRGKRISAVEQRSRA